MPEDRKLDVGGRARQSSSTRNGMIVSSAWTGDRNAYEAISTDDERECVYGKKDRVGPLRVVSVPSKSRKAVTTHGGVLSLSVESASLSLSLRLFRFGSWRVVLAPNHAIGASRLTLCA